MVTPVTLERMGSRFFGHRELTHVLLAFLVFILPFEYFITLGLGVFHTSLPVFFHPALWCLLVFQYLHQRSFFSFVVASFFDMVFFILISGFFLSFCMNPHTYQESLQSIAVLLWAYSLCSINLFRNNALFRSYYFGSVAWLIVVITAYSVMIMKQADLFSIKYQTISDMLIYARFPGEEVLRLGEFYFFLIVGNVNKASNIVLLQFLFFSWAYLEKVITTRFFSLISILMCLALMIFFSRGAFLVSLSIFFVFAVWSLYSSRKDFKRIWFVALTALIPFLLSVSTPVLRSYWGNSSTIQTRLVQWEQLAGNASISSLSVKDYIFGLGSGGYGTKFFNSADAGTHNFFLDLWMQAGLLGLLSFISLLFVLFKTSINLMKYNSSSSGVVLFSVLGAVLVLGFREFDLVYLFRSNTTAFLFFYISKTIYLYEKRLS